MKPFLIIVLLSAYGDIFGQPIEGSSLKQGNWRWRNDNGSEATATWKAAENTMINLTSSSEIFRLRIEVYSNIRDPEPVPVFDTLQYATSPAGPWTNLDTLAGATPFMIATTSAFVVQNEPTTAQLTGIALPFVAGKIMIDSMVLKNFILLDQERTEFEWVIRGTSNLLPNTTYYFRHWGPLETDPLPVETTYPSLTTVAVLPVKFTSFQLNREEKKIKLEWTTESEQNNSRFNIQRSADGVSWKTITDIQGHGSITGLRKYTAYDESPLNGINYYVIKQYDTDGHYYLSDVRYLKMTKDGNLTISVFPNPSHFEVSFSLTDQSAHNVEATLTNINGRIIHREIFKNIQANEINKLNMRWQPVSAIYILKVTAKGHSESSKVVIE